MRKKKQINIIVKIVYIMVILKHFTEKYMHANYMNAIINGKR